MNGWREEAAKKLEDVWTNDGADPRDAVDVIVEEFLPQIRRDATLALLRNFKESQKKRWAEPDPDMDQLTLRFGDDVFAIPDTPVRIVDADGDVTYKPARLSTGAERTESIEARIAHHQSHVRRAEQEHTRERQQIARAEIAGIDLWDTPWDQIRHANTSCWRCGLGWRAGDPFEHGHYDAPASKGGVKVDWEHRSCNRQARANPTPERVEP